MLIEKAEYIKIGYQVKKEYVIIGTIIRQVILKVFFARGDRRLSEVIIKAVENGCKFDGWGEHFKFDVWMQTF